MFFQTLVPLLLSSSALALPTLTTRTTQASTELCGDYDYIILQDSPWIVYNMLYNADEIVGTQCTDYGEMTTSTNGTKEVVWSSVTDIEYVESTYAPTPFFPLFPSHDMSIANECTATMSLRATPSSD